MWQVQDFDENIQHSFRVVNCLFIGFNSVKRLRTSEGSILSVIDSNDLPPAIMALNQAAQTSTDSEIFLLFPCFLFPFVTYSLIYCHSSIVLIIRAY